MLYLIAEAMRLTNSRAGFVAEGELEELVGSLATVRALEASLVPEIQARMLADGLPDEVPDDVCASIVEDGGFRLLDDDGEPASSDVVISLGRKVWERLVEMAQMELEDEGGEVESWLP